MDFHNMKRKELQALCKKHGIPANLTNLEMANKLSSIIKVNNEKPLTQGRSCLKVFDETVNDRESDVVDRTLKKVKFSPDDEIFEFTKLVEVKSRGRRKSMLNNKSLSVKSDGVKIGILDSPVRVTRSRGMNLEDGVSEKKGRTRRTKDSVLLENESEDEVGMTKRRSLRNKEVVSVQERREKNEGVNEGLRTSRRAKGEINANRSAEELDKSTSEKEIDRAEKRDKKVTFASDDQTMECMKAETKSKEMKRGGRRKSIAHTRTSHVPNEVDAKVRDEVLEKPAERITRSRNLKSVEDDVSNKRNQTRGKEVIERNVKQLCTEFVESSVEAANNEVKVTIRRSQQNKVVEEASHTALKRSTRQATKVEGARLTVEAANDEFKATTRRSQQNRAVEEAPQMVLTRLKRLPNKVEGARLTDDISKDKMVTRDRTRNQSKLVVEASTSEVVPQLDKQVEVPLRRSDKRKSVFLLEKLRSDEAVSVKEKRNLNVNDDEMANKGKKDEPLRALKRSKRLATQVEDSVLAKDDIAENKVVDRGMTSRNQSNLKRNVSSVETRCKTDRPTDSQGTVEVGITLEEPGEAPTKRSNRHKYVVPSLEKLRTDEVAAAKDKRNLDANDDNIRGKSTKEEPQKALKRSKGLVQQVKDSVPAKDDIAENKVEERRCTGRSAAKANIDTKILDGSVQEESAVVKEERRLSERSASKAYLDTKIFGSSLQEELAVVKEERRHSEIGEAKASVVTKILDSSAQEEISVAKEERRRSERSAAKANIVTETLDSSAKKEKPVVKEERRRSGRTASSLTLETVSDEKKESGENKLTKRICTPVPEKSSTKNKFAMQDLYSLKQSTSRAKTNVEAAAVDEKTSTAGKKQQGQQKRSNVEVEAPTSEDMEIVRESDSKECDISGSEGATSFLKSGLNELEAVKNDVNMVFAGSKDEAAADSNTLAENLKEKEPLVDANASPSENNSSFKCPPFSDPFSSNARPDEKVVEELLQSDHEAPPSKGLCPSSVLSDDAIPKDITSDKQEHGAIAVDDAEEFDTELSNEVIDNSSLHHSDNMEENLESGLKEQSETGCIVDEGITYGEQEPACNLSDDAVPNDSTLDKKEHGAVAADNADEFGTGSNEVLDNYSLNQSDNMEDNLESGFKKQSETGFIVTEGITSGEQEQSVTNYAREFDAGFSSNVSLDSAGAFNLSNKMEVKNSESGPPMEKAEAGFIAKCDGDAHTFTTQGELHAEGFANLEEATKEFSSISQPDNDAAGLSSAVTFEKSCDHGKQSTFRPRNSLDCGIQTSSDREFDENLNRRGQASSVSGNDNSSLQSSVHDCDEHGQGEILKSLFATPFGRGSNKAEIATSIELNETSSQYTHSCHANESTGEELKSLCATPVFVSRSIGGESYHFQSQLSGEAMTMEEGLGSSGKRNSSEPVGGLIEDEQAGEYLKNLSASPISVKSTNAENTSTKGKYNQSHEMETFSCSGLERNVGECEDGPAGVDQAREISHIAAFNYDDGSEQEDQLKMPSASLINTQTLSQMDGTSRKTEELSTQGLSHNSGLSVANPSAVDLSKSDSIDSKQSEDITVEKTKETPECIKGSSSLEEENNEGQGNMLSATSAQSMTPLRKAELSSQEPKTADVAMSGEMVRDQGMNARPESRVLEIVDIEEHGGTDEIVADRDLLLRDTSKALEEDVDVEIANQSTFSVISEPTLNDADFSEEQILEINKSIPDSSKPSDDVYNEENTEDHLKLLFATPFKGTCPPRLSEASTSQLKTTMITIASEMVGKEPKCKGFEFSEEPLTVEIIDGEQFKRGALFVTPYKSASPLQLEESFGCLLDTAELVLSTKGIDSKARNKSQGCPLRTMEAKESLEPSKDSEALEHIESSLQEPEIEEAMAGTDLLLIDTSEYPEENICVEIANKNTSAVISEPVCDDLEFSEQQMVLETHKNSPESIKQSEAVNEENSEDHLKLLFATPNKGTSPSGPESIKPYDAINEENSDDHLKLLFATPIKGMSPSKLGEDSTCQLKTAMVATASEMVGKEPKRKGSEFSGEPLTVEIITGGSSSTKGSCLFKENEEQFKGVPLFAKASKSTSPLQLEQSPCPEEDIFKDMDDGKFLCSQEQSFALYEDRQLLNEMIDDTGEATLNWFHTNDGSVLRETELETQKENDSVPQFEPLHEKGEVTEDDALAEGQAHNRQMTSQESPEDEAAKGGSVSDAVCQQPNMLLSDIETENITQESLRKTDGTSISAESGILDIDAESTTLRSQEKVIITLEETRGDEEQSLEVRNTSNAFHYNIPNNDEVAKEISIVWPADKQFHFPEHSVIENVASTRVTSSTIECQNVIKEVDLAVQRDRLTVFESNESTSMNVKDSVLTTQMDLPGILCEEAKSESDRGKSCEANQQDEFSFDKKEHETPESVVSHSYKSRANISFIEGGFAGEDTLMSEKKNSLAAKKEPFTPAGVAKTSLAEHLTSTVKKKNVRTILIHGTPNKQSQKADMKENDPNVKGNIGTLTALRPEKRRALQILPWK